jgi:hypothetical protein
MAIRHLQVIGIPDGIANEEVKYSVMRRFGSNIESYERVGTTAWLALLVYEREEIDPDPSPVNWRDLRQ